MPKKPAVPEESTSAPLVERRAARGGHGGSPLKKIKGALGRPMTLEWRNGQPHVVLVERRQTPFLDRAQAHLCDELRSRLLVQDADETSKLLRYLVVVHDALRHRGWEGVGKLPTGVLSKAAMQAEMLASDDPTPAMTQLAAQLRQLHAAAVVREDAAAPADRAHDADVGHTLEPYQVEVSETSFNEFEKLEQSWVRTRPSDLAPLAG